MNCGTSGTGERIEKAGRIGRAGTGETSGTGGGQAERAFVRCLSFANCSLIVRLLFVTYSAAPARRLSFAHRSVKVGAN